MPTIAINPFVRRQTPASRFSHFDGSEEELLRRVHEHFYDAAPGYRDGVVLVPVEPDGFWSSTVKLEPGDRLVGAFESRAPGEEPRKETYVAGRSKQPAVAVDVVLYRGDVLRLNNEESSDADWEVIALVARLSTEPEPMNPSTLMANHFEISGGTPTLLSDSEFVAQLRTSFLSWRDKALARPDLP
jgi:hypothetical protein